MKARYFLPVLLATVCAAVMAVGNSTVQAAAKATPAAVDVDPAAEALAQHEGVSLGEATARINRQASQSALADKLAALYPASYAGAYVDQADHGDLVARFTKNPTDFAVRAKQFGLAGHARLGATAQYSLAQLTLLQGRAMRTTGASLSSINPVTNTVDLQVADSARAAVAGRASAAAATVPGGAIRLVSTGSATAQVVPLSCGEDSLSRPGCNQPVRGGQGILTGPDSHGNSYLCTLGFSTASNVDNKLYSITAGHCFDGIATGTTVKALVPSGQFNSYGIHWKSAHVAGTPKDWGIVALNAGLQQEGDVYVQATNDGIRATTRDENYAINSVSGTTVSQYYCKTGASGGTACGQVYATGVSTTDQYGNPATTNMAEVFEYGQRETCEGDSGGPVYAAHQGVGLVEGGLSSSQDSVAPDGAPCYATWFYVSLSSALADMGVHLVSP